jgi:(p)ppGpp synthase/HD superfamily hydrolase
LVAAAHLHDILEAVFPARPEYSFEWIVEEFGAVIGQHVFDLTDQYTKANYPHWNRANRKQKEAERLGSVSSGSKTVKLADLISNTDDIMLYDRKFAKTYLKEKQALLPYLAGGDGRLLARAQAQIVVAT